MTSRTNAQELGRLRKAREEAQDRFARQTKLLELLENTAAELAKVTAKWQAQLAALVELAGNAAAAAVLSGLPKADIEAAAKGTDKTAVAAVLEAARPAPRRRRGSGRSRTAVSRSGTGDTAAS